MNSNGHVSFIPIIFLHVTLLTKAFLVSSGKPIFFEYHMEIHNGGNLHYNDCNTINYSLRPNNLFVRHFLGY
jgi:hypothetical protein